MEICGLCPFNFAMAWCFQSQVAWEISSHGTPVLESWSIPHLAVMALFMACTALGQVCDVARHRTRVYPSRLDHSSFGDLCFLRNMHSHKWESQTNIITLWLASKQDTSRHLAIWRSCEPSSLEPVRWHPAAIFLTWLLLFLVSDGPKRHFPLVVPSSRGRHWPCRLLIFVVDAWKLAAGKLRCYLWCALLLMWSLDDRIRVQRSGCE